MMSTSTKPIYICRYNYTKESYHWLLTEEREYARSIDPNFQLASLGDLLDWVAASGETFTGILAVKEGFCKWVEQEYIDDFGELDIMMKYELLPPSI